MTNTAERQSLDRIAKECGDLIKAFRKAKKLDQAALAAKLSVQQSTVSRWERGDRIPKDYWRKRIATELGDTNGVIFRRLEAAS